MSEKIGQNPRGASVSGHNWLSPELHPYNSPGFGQALAGKLAEMSDTSGSPSTVMGMHYSNVAIGYAHQYGLDVENKGANAAVVVRSGNQGSEVELRIPATAAMMHKAWNIIVGPELAWSAVPSTTDFASESKAVNARNALTYLWTHENAGAIARGSALDALFQAETVMHIPWDKSLGTDVGPIEDSAAPQGEMSATQPPRVERSGWMRFTPIPTWDVFRDRSVKAWEQQSAFIIREWQNKYDRAALCDDEDEARREQKAARCKGASGVTQIGQSWAPLQERYESSGDTIPVYYLYAKRTPSVPAGRQTVFLEDGTVLEDGPLDEAYKDVLPVVRMSAGEYRGTPWPYTKYFACCGAAQATDALYAALTTNATAVSGPVLSVEQSAVDAGAAMATLSGGPQMVPRPDGTQPPAWVAPSPAHPEHFNLIGKFRNEVQQIIGLDALTAGEEIGANLSGAAMVMMTSTSVQNNSQLQASWRDYVQAIGNVALKHIQHHMSEEKQIALAGNARASLVTTTTLSRDSVAGIERVTCTIGSAMTQTDAGKYEIATTALKEGWAQTPEQFQTVMDTGRLDALTQDLSNELLLVNAENEGLGKGEMVPVTPYDNHVLHLKLHRAVLASLTARRQVNVLRAVQQHMDAHVAALVAAPQSMPPAVLEMLGIPVVAGGPGAPPPSGPQPSGGPPPELPANAPPGAGAKPPDGVPTPQAPKDPRSGRPAGPAAGVVPPAMDPQRAAA